MIAIPHPIKQAIDSQYYFLLSMLDLFPNLLEEWSCKQKKEVEQLSRAEANDDYVIYHTIYSAEILRVESCDDKIALFNNAMLIMVYSYYESMLFRLAKEIMAESSTPSCIASSFNAILESEYLEISEFLFKTIRPLRNELCHNNNGTLFEKCKKEERDNIEKLMLNNKKISIYENRITVIDREFIKDVLNCEHKLLTRLSEICNYNTTFVTSQL